MIMKDIKTNIPLPEVVWFQEGPGVRNTQYTISGVKLLNVANLVDGKIDLSTSDRYISEEEAYGRYKHFMADEGDLIIASSGIKVEYIDKKIGFIHKEHLPLCMNTSTIRFKVIDDKELNIKFFMYFLKSNEFKHQLFRHITGCAQLNFGPSHLKKMIISYPPLPEQSRIVEELDLLSNTIEKKRQQLSELDNLAQSIFYDMFGDPVTNEKGWEVKKLGEFCQISSSKRIYANEYCEEGIPFYRGKEITEKSKSNDISVELFISAKKYEELKDKFGVPKIGDILITAVGTIGNIWVVDTDEPFYFKDGNVLWLQMKSDINPVYFKFLLEILIDKHKTAMANGCAYSALTIVNLREMGTNLIPLNLQQLFAKKIEAIEIEKKLIKQSIAETEELFNSRMDYYFN